jgi:hypothetical protein
MVKKIITRGLAAILAAGALVTGCGNAFVPQSQIKGLRVFGVKIDTPYAKPGKKVNLEMLHYDGSPRAGAPNGGRREVQILWLGGCHTPAGDLYYGCYPILAEKLRAIDPGMIGGAPGSGGLPPPDVLELIGLGTKFSVSIPDDIVSSRAERGGGNTPYGLSYAFFAVCGGELGPASDPSSGFPLGCYDKDTKALLGPDDFVVGYTPIYSYEKLENANPIITGGTWQGKASMDIPCTPCIEDCGDASCEVACQSTCPPTQICGAGSHLCITRVAHCGSRNVIDCDTYDFKPTVDPASAEIDETANAFEDGKQPQETLWVSYFANQGTLIQDMKLINDAQEGWNEDYKMVWTAPNAAAGESRIWGVVHDNRGGTNWWMQDIFIE